MKAFEDIYKDTMELYEAPTNGFNNGFTQPTAGQPAGTQANGSPVDSTQPTDPNQTVTNQTQQTQPPTQEEMMDMVLKQALQLNPTDPNVKNLLNQKGPDIINHLIATMQQPTQ